MCAMTSRPYDWDLRNIAKIDQGTATRDLFQFFSKTVERIRTQFCTVTLNHIEVLLKTSYDSNEIFYTHSALCGGPMCAMLLTS